jgi:predicted nucleic acid-binding protein
MSYLLDINVLLAFTYESHVFHSKVESWIWHVESTNLERPLFALCSMVELGFIRIASGSSKLAESLFAARSDLRRTKAALQPAFLPDDVEGDRLPSWVTVSKHTTDGHLLELANRH